MNPGAAFEQVFVEDGLVVVPCSGEGMPGSDAKAVFGVGPRWQVGVAATAYADVAALLRRLPNVVVETR